MYHALKQFEFLNKSCPTCFHDNIWHAISKRLQVVIHLWSRRNPLCVFMYSKIVCVDLLCLKNCQLTRYQLSLSIKKCNVNVRCKVNKVSITIFWVSVGQEGKATRTPCVSHSNDRLLTFPCYIVAHVWNTYNCWNTWTNVRFLQKTTENYKL